MGRRVFLGLSDFSKAICEAHPQALKQAIFDDPHLALCDVIAPSLLSLQRASSGPEKRAARADISGRKKGRFCRAGFGTDGKFFLSGAERR